MIDSGTSTSPERDSDWTGPMLAVGLRACADEAVSWADRRALRGLARGIEQGERIESLLDGSRPLPVYLREVLKEGIYSDRFPHILEEYLRTTRQLRSVWSGFYKSLIYPLIMVLVAGLIVTGLMVAVTETMQGIFNDFGVELPAVTTVVLGFADLILLGGWVFPIIVILALPTALALHARFPGRGGRVRLLQAIPIIGPARRFAGGAEMCSRLAVLVDAGVPLHRALEIMSQSLRDFHLRRVCRLLSREIAAGLPAEDVPISGPPGLLPAVAGAFRWAREPQLFADGLKSLSESLAAQARVRSDQFAVVIEPVTVMAVGLMVGTVVLGMFMPLIKLLNELS